MVSLVFAIHLHPAAPEVKSPHGGDIGFLVYLVADRKLHRPPHTGHFNIIVAGSGQSRKISNPGLFTRIFLAKSTTGLPFENHLSGGCLIHREIGAGGSDSGLLHIFWQKTEGIEFYRIGTDGGLLRAAAPEAEHDQNKEEFFHG